MTNNQTNADSGLHFLDYWRIIRIRKWQILGIFLLVVTTATFVALLQPKGYTSTVRMMVKKDIKDAQGVSASVSDFNAGFDPYFIQTQFEMIQSQEILYKVIEELGLNVTWAKRYGSPVTFETKETFVFLSKQINVTQTRNTEYLQVQMVSVDPEEAALIANRIAEIYKEHRIASRRDRLLKGIATLERDKENHREAVGEMQAKLDKMRVELGISEFSPEGTSAGMTLEPETLRRLEAARIEMESEFIAADRILIGLEEKSPSELERAILAVQFDGPLSRLREQKDQAEIVLGTKREDFGDKNPEVSRALASLDKIQTLIDLTVKGILDGLGIKRDSIKASLDQQITRVKEAKEKSIEVANNSAPFWKLRRELEQKMKLLEVEEFRIQDTILDSELTSSDVVRITDIAEVSKIPSHPRMKLIIACALVGGLLAGVGLAFFIEYVDTSVKTLDDVEAALGAPVLSVIPQRVGSLLNEDPDVPHAEAYRVLRTNLLFGRKDKSHNTFTVISAGAGEGKSTTIFNTAITFAQSGDRVLLVDSDLRRPSLHKKMGVSNAVGLTNVLLEKVTAEDAIQTTPEENLHFLPSGKLPSSAMGIMNSPQLKEFAQEMSKRYDYVFFDAPPIMGVSDASILSSMMDLTVLVIQYRKYPLAMNLRAKQTVDKVGGHLAGVVMNNINIAQDSYYYYAGYQYGTYGRDEDQAPEEERKASSKRKDDSSGSSVKQKY
ncbi:polysaccharide biosynthesis tyrosine autokinase [Verrucomicrobia bacterium]|nr:polysaccharide biosynthesis tyrosine autokinase [Verrucomicrobiota bacterium]MDB4459161.1 polysaccharide biosynthesis tyrosine autokinase [bacterium]